LDAIPFSSVFSVFLCFDAADDGLAEALDDPDLEAVGFCLVAA
jgi:hypothetical protein